MRVVIDTNVILSAFLTQGMSNLVLEKCLRDHSVYLSDWIKREIKDNLKKKFHFNKNEIETALGFIENICVTVKPKGKVSKNCRDRSDNNLLLLTDFVSAKVLITGDKDLLVLKKYKNTRILTPKNFYQKYLLT